MTYGDAQDEASPSKHTPGSASSRAGGTCVTTPRAGRRGGLSTGSCKAREWQDRGVTEDSRLPERLTLDQAYRAAFFMTDQYIEVESGSDEGLALFHQYLQSDPARWEDWKQAVREALRADATPDPLAENLLRD